MTLRFFVLIRENLKVAPGDPQRLLPVAAHWDEAWLRRQESSGDETRWFVTTGTCECRRNE